MRRPDKTSLQARAASAVLVALAGGLLFGCDTVAKAPCDTAYSCYETALTAYRESRWVAAVAAMKKAMRDKHPKRSLGFRTEEIPQKLRLFDEIMDRNDRYALGLSLSKDAEVRKDAVQIANLDAGVIYQLSVSNPHQEEIAEFTRTWMKQSAEVLDQTLIRAGLEPLSAH